MSQTLKISKSLKRQHDVPLSLVNLSEQIAFVIVSFTSSSFFYIQSDSQSSTSSKTGPWRKVTLLSIGYLYSLVYLFLFALNFTKIQVIASILVKQVCSHCRSLIPFLICFVSDAFIEGHQLRWIYLQELRNCQRLSIAWDGYVLAYSLKYLLSGLISRSCQLMILC